MESLSLHVVSARPPRVRVDVSGTLPDACTEIGPVEIQRFPGRVEIALPTRRGFGARCDPAATGYARSVPLVLGVEFPVWTVTVNGVSGRIALPPEALGEPLR